MLRIFSGLFLALLPLESISAFYLDDTYFHGFYFPGVGDWWWTGILCLIAAWCLSFATPIAFAIWCVVRRNRIATVYLVASLFAAVVSLSLLHFDPGNRIVYFQD